MKAAVYVSRRYFQLKSGQAITGTYLRHIGKTETDKWWECTSQARIDTHHVLLSYSVWTDERINMPEKCEKDGVGNPRIVRQLLGSRKATPAVLEFIRAMRAGQRVQKQEEKIRKQKREKDKAWSLGKRRLKRDEEVEEGEGERERSKRSREGRGLVRTMHGTGSNEQREDIITGRL